MLDVTEVANFEIFRDCLSTPLIQKCTAEPPKSQRKRLGASGRKNTQVKKPENSSTSLFDVGSNDAEELAEFIDVRDYHVYNKYFLKHGATYILSS